MSGVGKMGFVTIWNINESIMNLLISEKEKKGIIKNSGRVKSWEDVSVMINSQMAPLISLRIKLMALLLHSFRRNLKSGRKRMAFEWFLFDEPRPLPEQCDALVTPQNSAQNIVFAICKSFNHIFRLTNNSRVNMLYIKYLWAHFTQL